MNQRDNNTRLGDISYQLSKIAQELRIIREFLSADELHISGDEFNRKYKEKYGEQD